MNAGIALIPARGGSKRIPRKNVRPFLGVPAIQRVIRTVDAAGIVRRIIVSTDDEEVARLARKAGADVPGSRPSGLASDDATTIEVVHHAIESWLRPDMDKGPLWVIYPTALLLSVATLQDAAREYGESGSAFLYSVLRYPHPVERRLAMDQHGRVRPVHPEHAKTRTQDLVATFHDAGQFYVGSVQAWLAGAPILSEDAVGLELPGDSVVDIDEPEDWVRAERVAMLLGEELDAPAGSLE